MPGENSKAGKHPMRSTGKDPFEDPAVPRRKKLIVCCDGTGHREIAGKIMTNVSKIARYISATDSNGNSQIVFYQRGVGTDTLNPAKFLKQAIGAGKSIIILWFEVDLC